MDLFERQPMKFEETIKKQSVDFTRKLADWLCQMQYPMIELSGDAGRLNFMVEEDGWMLAGNQWNAAFAIMGWLSAYKVFGDERYLESAMGAARYLKSLQIFDPFLKHHYGAIRELTPQTTWCYPRDSVSAAWGFVELYRFTHNQEWLDRAVLFAEWFLREGLDDDGWPRWGIIFEELMEKKTPPQFCDTIQGCFHGGGMNFFYQLAEATGDKKWVGDFYVRMADYYVDFIQQDDGFFRSIDRTTKKTPKNDPQNGLHRANDDLGTLALLGAYKVTGNKKYLTSIEKFLNSVFAKQDADGMFEDSVASIPVVLNIVHELTGVMTLPAVVTDQACAKALKALFQSQELRARNPKTYGGLLEEPRNRNFVCVRSGCYSLIYLLKEFSGVKEYLAC
jgi:uncharacterized protein YyaL (SSP411 family)